MQMCSRTQLPMRFLARWAKATSDIIFPTRMNRFAGSAAWRFSGTSGRCWRRKNARATNIDVTVIAEAPKLQPHIEQMRAKIGSALGCDASRINIKATTNEGLGTIGRGEGMACLATAIVEDL